MALIMLQVKANVNGKKKKSFPWKRGSLSWNNRRHRGGRATTIFTPHFMVTLLAVSNNWDIYVGIQGERRKKTHTNIKEKNIFKKMAPSIGQVG